MSEDNPVRTAVNEWIRQEGNFDGVVDLGTTVRDKNATDDFAAGYYLDGRHPNVAGYGAMGKAVDLDLLRR